MENSPFIDGLPINSMVFFHGELLNNQMVSYFQLMLRMIAPAHQVFGWLGGTRNS